LLFLEKRSSSGRRSPGWLNSLGGPDRRRNRGRGGLVCNRGWGACWCVSQGPLWARQGPSWGTCSQLNYKIAAKRIFVKRFLKMMERPLELCVRD
jgi:hypothetical protein